MMQLRTARSEFVDQDRLLERESGHPYFDKIASAALCRRQMRAFSGKAAMDTYAGRAAAQRPNPRDRATAGEGLTAAHLPAVTREFPLVTDASGDDADPRIMRGQR
jgi:hypothetical protein